MLPQPVDTCCALFCSFAAFETWSIFRLVRVFVFLALSFPYCFWPLNMGCKNSCSTDPHRLGTVLVGLLPRYVPWPTTYRSRPTSTLHVPSTSKIGTCFRAGGQFLITKKEEEEERGKELETTTKKTEQAPTKAKYRST